MLRSVLLMFALLISSSGHAQESTTKPARHAGLLIGFADPTNVESRLGYGVEAGMTFATGWTALLFGYSSTSVERGLDETTSHFGAGLDYALGECLDVEWLRLLRVGMKAGTSLLAVKLPAPFEDVNKSDFAWGPSLGVDQPLGQGTFTAGLQGDILIGPEFSVLYAFGTLKYWF